MDGVETYVVRFYETERYDIDLDREVIRFCAATPTGTYNAEVETGTASKIRERRESFKEYVLSCLASKIPPHEMTLG